MFNCINNEDIENPLQYFNEIINTNNSKLSETKNNLKIFVGKFCYQKNIIIEEIDIITRIIRKYCWQLQNTILSDAILLEEFTNKAIHEINLYFQLIVGCIKDCDCITLKERYICETSKSFSIFSTLVLPLIELEDEILIRIINISSSVQKKKCSSIYSYFHAFLDLQYYLLLINYICNKPVNQIEEKLEKLLKDLIKLSLKRYELNNTTDSSFICSCTKTFWLFLQNFTQLLYRNSDSDFWKLLNNITATYGNGNFVLWLLKDLVNLQSTVNNTLKPNLTLVEVQLKSILTNSELSLKTLKSLYQIICELWLNSANITPYQLLWDYFSKHLNTMTAKRTFNNIHCTEIIEMLDKILWYPHDCDEEFEFFVGMLLIHLKLNPNHWSKIKGRIYSQLSPNKIRDLNEVGILHISLLFLALTQINCEELVKKFLNFIENLPEDRRQTRLVFSINSALILKFVRENHVIDEKVIKQKLKMLEQVTGEHKTFHLIKNFVNNDLDSIIQVNSSNLQLNQWLLIDSWIQKYLITCTHADLVTVLKILMKIIDLIETDPSCWMNWEETYKTNIYTSLKYISSQLTAPEISGILAAKICILTPTLLEEAFNYFNSESIIAKVSTSFLCVILRNYPNDFILTQNQEIIAIKSWIKACLLTKDNQIELTNLILKLDTIPKLIKDELNLTKDPLIAFIESLSTDIDKQLKSLEINRLCEICFGDVDRWISQYLNQQTSDHCEAIILRIYTHVAIAFYRIGPLLYDRYKTTSPVTKLLSTLLLTSEILIGKTIPNQFMLQGIKKTWHLFFEALTKLNSPGDSFIERTLRDLIVKFIPHFPISECPFVKCLDNSELAPIILEKISNVYLKQPTKEVDGNVFKVLKMIQNYVESTTSLNSLKLIVKKTLFGLFEIVICHNQRNTALGVIKSITSSLIYSEIVDEFGEIIVSITAKHLAFNTLNYFQFMNTLAKFIPNDIQKIVGNVKQQISVVERMRGVGFDKNLRQHLEKLEAIIQATKE